MVNSFSLWLFQASAAIILLTACYKLLLEKLTFFELNRGYLVLGMLACLTIPLLPTPYFLNGVWSETAVTIPASFDLSLKPNATPAAATLNNVNEMPFDWFVWILRLLIALYFGGVLYKTVGLLISLSKLVKLKKSSIQLDTINGIPTFSQGKLPTFSFFNNIFLNDKNRLLSEWELQQIMFHERVHIVQKHSYDVMFYEVATIVFWFNPCVYYLSKTIRQVHEYLVDHELNINKSTSAGYGELLIKLATKSGKPSLVHTFSDSEIFHRITMLTKPQSNPMQKLKFLSILPIMGSLVVLSSFTTQPETASQTNQSETVQTNSGKNANLKIAKITWVGNTKYTSDELDKVLGIKVGERYDSLQLDKRLQRDHDNDVASMYMNNGYLFFRAEPTTVVNNNEIALKIEIFEGQKGRIGKVDISGNKKISKQAVLDIINIKPNDLFNKRKIVEAMKNLKESGKFGLTSINVIPDNQSFANNKEGLVDLQYDVTEL
jgi:beta-lactamase regulating signal transducer with metallopeptidase domain